MAVHKLAVSLASPRIFKLHNSVVGRRSAELRAAWWKALSHALSHVTYSNPDILLATPVIYYPHLTDE